MQKRLVAVFVLMLVLSGQVSALSLDDIIKFFESLFSGRGGEVYVEEMVCNPPYILVGRICCLDRNKNMICDKDEAPTTTLRPSTTSTQRETTTTLLQTTTTEAAITVGPTLTTQGIRCRTNADCGQPLEEKLCKDGDVWLKKTIQMCTKPGTPESACSAKVTASKAQTCGELYCVNAECVEIEDEESSTTTTAQQQTTTTQQQTTTTVQGTTLTTIRLQTTTTQRATTTTQAPRCGDGIVNAIGEECEQDADCGHQDAKCAGCLCQFNCNGFCNAQGANGFRAAPGIATKDDCDAAGAAAGNALSADCRVTCWKSAFFNYQTPRGAQKCCCTDADWKPCNNCPNANRALIDCNTPAAQCSAGL